MDAITEFRSMMRQLKLDAGNPSYRDIARLSGRRVSPAKAHRLFTEPGIPQRWDPHLSAVIAALGGDKEKAFMTWKAAWLAQEGKENA